MLVDLKPALDGYAGIPQESRLLFRELVRLGNLDVEGLIQHGGRRLRPGLKPDASRLSVDKRVDLLSKVVVSLYENPYSNLWEQALQGLDKLFARQGLRLRSHLGGRSTTVATRKLALEVPGVRSFHLRNDSGTCNPLHAGGL